MPKTEESLVESIGYRRLQDKDDTWPAPPPKPPSIRPPATSTCRPILPMPPNKIVEDIRLDWGRISLSESQRSFELKFERLKLEGQKEFNRRWQTPNDEGKNMQIKDYSKIVTVGTGTFGQVILAKQKKSKQMCAVKIIPKAKVARNPQHAINERWILQAIDFPFVIKLCCSFKDNDNLYIVMPFVQGGELFNFLSHKGKLNERLVKFYAAQLVLALDYLHSFNIVYRDLKPENVLIGKDGYLVITDFGLSKRIQNRTWTLAGTKEYLAPEVIQNRGHNTAVDWWTLGIMLYELSAGVTPFSDPNEIKMYEKIVEGRINFPSHFTHLFQDLLSQLIQKDLSRRLGNLRYGACQIRSHPWFTDIDWLEIYKKETKSPFVPRFKNGEDTSYFKRYPEDNSILKIGPTDQFAQGFADF